MFKKITLSLALALAGMGAASAAQFSASGGAVAGRIDGVTFQQTPYGLNGGAGARTGDYTGLQASASVSSGAAMMGLNAMKSTGGVEVDDLSASAGYALQASPDLVITPGVQWGVQHVDGQAYTRQAATLGVGYSITPEWVVLGSAAVGRVHGTRDALMHRVNGDYRAGQIAVSYSPPKIGTFTLAATEQVTQTAADLPGLGDLDMRDRAVSLTYSRTF